MQEVRQRGRSSQESWLAEPAGGGGKDYDLSIVPVQLGLKERERGQQLAHGAPRMEPLDGEWRSPASHFRWTCG
ncbi:hypothetical protein VZT92_003833 [Zoarces viviparus]